MRSSSRFRLAWAPLGIGVVAGAILVATAWSAERAIARASTEVAEREGLAFVEATHAHLHGALPLRIHEVDLAPFLASRRDAGLTYVAVLAPDGTVEREAGTRSPVDLSAHGLVRVEEAFTFTAAPPGPPDEHPRPGPPPHEGGPPGDGAHGAPPPHHGPPAIRVVFEGREAAALRSEGRRLLVIGTAAGVLLTFAAWVLGRLLRQRVGLLRAQARDRQLAVLGEMTAVIAHELRNPLASLKGHAQLLEEGLTENPKQSKRAARVVKDAVRLEQLGADLIAFVRAGTVDRSDVEVAGVVERALELVDRNRVDVVRTGPTRFSLDATKMQQVLVNLVDNAIQASPDGARVELRVGGGVEGDDDALTVDVRDRGAGVTAADRDRIFEPFVTTRVRGTGLGLAFAKRVVELHGGSISVDDAAGGGAVFRVVLPRR